MSTEIVSRHKAYLKVADPVDVAAHLLLALLDGRDAPATEIRRLGEQIGIRPGILRRVRKLLGGEVVRRGATWFWHLEPRPVSDDDEPTFANICRHMYHEGWLEQRLQYRQGADAAELDAIVGELNSY